MELVLVADVGPELLRTVSMAAGSSLPAPAVTASGRVRRVLTARVRRAAASSSSRKA